MSTKTIACDHVVIGSGIVGRSAARYLKLREKNVVLIDQNPIESSNGGSSGKSRVIRIAYEEDYFTKMMVDGYKMWKEIEEESGEQLIIKTGMMILGKTAKKAVDAHCNNMKEFTGDCLTKIDNETMKEKYPQLAYPKDYDKFFEETGGVVLANKALSALQKIFTDAGGIIYESCKVINIIPGDTITVITTNGTFHTPSLIIAAGPWTNKVLKPLNIQLPIKTPKVRVYYWKEKVLGEHTKDKGFPTFIDCDGFGDTHVYGLPAVEYPGHVKICAHGGDECNPDEKDTTGMTDYYIDQLCQYVKQHFPGLEHEKPSIIETCIYSETPDRSFVLDYHPSYKNIVIGAGFSGTGFKLGPLVGKILGDLALNTPLSHSLKPFLISRFHNVETK